MADTQINLTTTNPTATETTPGGYTINIALGVTNPTVTFSGPGAFAVDGIATALSTYTLIATGGAALTINNLALVSNTANLIVDSGSTIALASGVGLLSTVNATFRTVGGTLSIASGDTPGNFIPNITGFAAGDHLDFGGTYAATDTVAYDPTTGYLTVSVPSGIPGINTTIGQAKLVGTYSASAFSIKAAAGGIEVDLACFLRGTMIRTPDGDRPVESLSAGSLVTAADGSPLPVVALRTRAVDLDLDGAAVHRPVLFRAGSIAPGIPSRDLAVSPDHSMHLDGVFVPASLLVNGESIVRAELSGTIEYLHVEVEPHAVLLAEGAATESYLDIGNGGHFAQRAGAVTLHPVHDPKTWEDACAPLVLTGPALAAIRARLAARRDALRDETAPVARAA